MPALTCPAAAAALATALLLPAGMAMAERLTLCNKGEDYKGYATVQIGHWNSLLPQWIASGWYGLDPGSCEEVSPYQGRTYVFFSMLSRPDKKTKATIDFYGVDDVRSLSAQPPGTYGVEVFLCVKDAEFTRVRDTLDEHRSCPEGYYQQLFNLLVIVEDAELTLNID